MCHAAGESAALRAPPPNLHAVILAASPGDLARISGVFEEQKIPHVSIYEDTPPYDNSLVAIGVAPCTPGVQRWLRSLRLLR